MIVQMKNLEDAISDMKNGKYDFTKNGECIQCGACCSNYLPMTKREVARIHKYINRNKSNLINSIGKILTRLWDNHSLIT